MGTGPTEPLGVTVQPEDGGGQPAPDSPQPTPLPTP
jgi:hypothetical protein